MYIGASTVLFPLWGGGSMGGDLGQLARLLLYLRFYFELPNYAHVGRPVAKALQMTQVSASSASLLVYIPRYHGVDMAKGSHHR